MNNHLTLKNKIAFAILVNLSCLCAFSNSSPTCANYGNGTALNIVYKVNGTTVPGLNGYVNSGDQVSVCFSLSTGCDSTLFSLVAYKAPSSTFDPSQAYLQSVFNSESRSLIGTDTFCLSVSVPNCYFQIDFVYGCVTYRFTGNNFYSDQGRLISSVNGGSGSCNCEAQANAGNDFTLNCNSTQATLSGSTTTYDPVISWTAINGGHIASGANTLNPVITSSGIYILTVYDTLHCSASDSVTVSGQTNVLTPGYIGLNQTHCGPFQPDTLFGVVPAMANPGDTITYQWLYSLVDTENTYGNSYWHKIPDANSSSYSPDSIFVTTYFIRCAKTVGCTFIGTTTESNIVTITVLPKVSVNLGNDTVICSGGSVVLDAENPGSSYYWNTGDTTRRIRVVSSGTFYVTVTNSDGCRGWDSIHIVIMPGFSVNLGNDTALVFCHHDTLILDAGIKGAHYRWCNGATTESIRVTSSGIYFVMVTDSFGCSASDTIKITITDLTIEVNLGKDTIACGCIVLNAGNPGDEFHWCDGEDYPAIRACSTGMYCVQVRNGYCIASDTVNIVIDSPPVVKLGKDTTLSGGITLNAGNAGCSYKWNTGATSDTITVVLSGTYYVTVTNKAGCIAIDSIRVYILSGIGGINETAYPVRVFPNPATDKTIGLYFEVPERRAISIKIWDQLGSIVYNDYIDNFSGSFNGKIELPNLAAGIYFIEVGRGAERNIQRVALN